MAAPRACAAPSLLLVTATPASDPGSHHPGYPIRTLGAGECARQRPCTARRVLSGKPDRSGGSATVPPGGRPPDPRRPRPVTSSRGPAEVLRADRFEEFSEFLHLF